MTKSGKELQICGVSTMY